MNSSHTTPFNQCLLILTLNHRCLSSCVFCLCPYLFINLNTLLDSQSSNLTGRPLARVALVHAHVLTYYQQVQQQFFKLLVAVSDGTTRETCKGKDPPCSMKHAGSMDKPFSYILA